MWQRHTPCPEEGVHRVLFVGPSQTWGAGAAVAGDEFVRVAEQILNSAGRNSRFECVNSDVSGMRSHDVLDVLNRQLLALGPHTVVVNLSNNDTDLEVFAKNLAAIAISIRAAEARPFLVLEPIACLSEQAE